MLTLAPIRFIKEVCIQPSTYRHPEWKECVHVEDFGPFSLRQMREGGGQNVLIIPPTAGHHPNICEPLIDFYLQNTSWGVYAFHLHPPRPGSDNANTTIADLVEYVRQCLLRLGTAHIIGLCQGGWLAVIVSALYNEHFCSLTVVNAPIDTHADQSNAIYIYSQMLPYSFYALGVTIGGGVQAGPVQLAGFYAISWPYMLLGRYLELFNAILRDDEKGIERFHRFSSWYDQPENIAGSWYLEAINLLFKRNALARGTLTIDDDLVDLSNIRCPTYLLSGENDQITSTAQLFALEHLVGGPVQKWTAPKTGHIGAFMPRKTRQWQEILTYQKEG